METATDYGNFQIGTYYEIQTTDGVWHRAMCVRSWKEGAAVASSGIDRMGNYSPRMDTIEYRRVVKARAFRD